MKYLPYFAIIIVVLLAGCGEPRPSTSEVQLSTASGTSVPPMEERYIPAFSKITLDGDSLSAESIRGKLTIVNFWATWCAPCVIETPALVALRNEWHDRGFEVIGVSMDDEGLDVVREFAERFNISYPLVHDTGALAEEFGGVYALPTSFVVDPEGKIIHRIIGVFPIGELREEMEALLIGEADPLTVAQ